MDEKKKNLQDILPEDAKKNAEKYPDHLKSPMNELEDKKTTLNKSKNDKQSN